MYKKPATYERIPVSNLFIDAVAERIYAGNVRRPHTAADGPGYQRDPYIRIKWVRNRVAKYNSYLLRPIEVSKRDDGTYAIVDGGGRWLLSQLAKKKADLDCRVHVGLTRAEEAELFFNFDREIYRLRAVDVYLAALAAGHPVIVEIDEAVKPFRISKSGGAATFDGVGTLYDLFNARGARLIKRTALAVANTWGGLKKGGLFAGHRVNGALFGSVAMILDIAPHNYEAGLRAVLLREDYSPAKLMKKVEKRLKGVPATTIEKSLLAAEILCQRVNAESEGVCVVDLRALRSSTLLEALEARAGSKIAFGSMLASDAAA